ncbi:hypothetical protein D3C86_1527270 [compost metagenome]
MYNKMDRPSRKAERRFEKYLGRKIGKLLTKSLPGFEPPQLAPSSHFTRCGNFITLYPDAEYYQKFPQNPKETFQNHKLEPYLLMMEKLPQ